MSQYMHQILQTQSEKRKKVEKAPGNTNQGYNPRLNFQANQGFNRPPKPKQNIPPPPNYTQYQEKRKPPSYNNSSNASKFNQHSNFNFEGQPYFSQNNQPQPHQGRKPRNHQPYYNKNQQQYEPRQTYQSHPRQNFHSNQQNYQKQFQTSNRPTYQTKDRGNYQPRDNNTRKRGRQTDRFSGNTNNKIFERKEKPGGDRKQYEKKEKRNTEQVQQKYQKQEESQEQFSQEKQQENEDIEDIEEEDDRDEDIQENQDQYEEESLNYSDEDDEGNGVPELKAEGETKAINQMCGREQFDDRLKTFQLNNKDSTKLKLDTTRSFTIFEINKLTNKPDFRLALKRFRRSADRGEDDDDDKNMNVRRTPKALFKAINHINNEIIDSDRKQEKHLPFPIPEGQRSIQFIQIYDFLWDRMREMIKDITRLNEEEKRKEDIVEICQQMARFFILAINEGRQASQSFDEKMNKESLTKVLTPLLEIYMSSRIKVRQLIGEMRRKDKQVTAEQIKEQMAKRQIYISPNEPQMTCYAILISQDYRKYLYDNICSGFDNYEFNPLLNSKEIKLALQIQNSLRLNNFEKFFKILQSKETDYVLSNLMLHHLHWVRKNACQRIFDTFKFLADTKPQYGILSSELIKILRFKENQNKMYSIFLEEMGLSLQSLYVVSKGLKEQQNIKMSFYKFDINKKKRSLYTAEVPKLSRPVQRMNEQITREELVKRSWYESNYPNQVLSSYLGEEVNFKIQKLLSEEVQIEKDDIIQEKDKPETNNLRELEAMREKMKGKKKRKLFLTNFQEKLEAILRKAVDKKQKVSAIFHLLENKVKNTQLQFFERLEDKIVIQQEQQLALIRFNTFAKEKKKFKSQINWMPYEFTKKPTTTEKRQMSDLLGFYQNQTNQPQTQIKEYLQNQLLEGRKSYQPFKIRIFHSQCFAQTTHYFKIMRKFISLILGREIQSLEEGQTYDFQDYPCIELTYHRLKRQVYSKVLGANCIIFIGIQNEFSQEIKELMDFYASMKKIVHEKFSISIGLFWFKLPGQSFMQEQLNVDFEEEAYLNSSLIKIPSNIKNTLQKLLEYALTSFRYYTFHEIQVQDLYGMINIIEGNLIYLQTKIAQEKETFIYYQEYMNLCFEKLLQINKDYFKNFELFENWFIILNELGDDERIYETELMSIKAKMKRQYQHNNTILKNLNFSIPQNLYAQNENYTIQELINFSLKELMKFDYNMQANQLSLKHSLKGLEILDGRIFGESIQFFKHFLQVLQNNLECYYIVLPKHYRFKLDFEELKQRVMQKNKYKLKKFTLPYLSFHSNQSSKRKQSINNGFTYERQSWINQCIKKTKIK